MRSAVGVLFAMHLTAASLVAPPARPLALARRARNWGVAIGGSKLVRAFWGKVFQPVPPPPPYTVLSLGVGSWMPQGAVGKTVVAFASLVFAALL